MSAPLLEGRALTCIRDGRELFADLDLALAAGALLQIEGANGAGKTSLLRILCGLLQPQAGEILWRGTDIRTCRPLYYGDLLFIGHSPGIKDDLTAIENLHFFQALGSHAGDAAQALDEVGLYGYEDVPVRSLSAGQRRRVALARLWLSTAKLWLLDEPLTALDPSGVANLEDRLALHIEAGGSIALTSHQPLRLGSVNRLRLA